KIVMTGPTAGRPFSHRPVPFVSGMDADPAIGHGATSIPPGVLCGAVARRCSSAFLIAISCDGGCPGHAERPVVLENTEPDFVSSGLLNSTFRVAWTCWPEPSRPSISYASVTGTVVSCQHSLACSAPDAGSVVDPNQLAIRSV